MARIGSSTNRVRKVIQRFAKTSLFVKALTVIVLAGLIWFIGTKILVKNSSQQPYQTAQAEKGTLITNVSASGTVSSGNNSAITTSATGVVTTLYVQNGDTVSAGDKIADLTLDRDSQ